MWKEESSGMFVFYRQSLSKNRKIFLDENTIFSLNFPESSLYSSSEKFTVRKYSSKQRLKKSNCKKMIAHPKKLRTKIKINLMTKDSAHFLHPAGYNVVKSFDLKKKLFSIRNINFVPKFRNICCFLRVCYF